MHSSSERITFDRPLRGAHIVLHDGAANAPEPRKSSFDIKELQRRAYERGVAHERERLGGTLGTVTSKLAAWAEQAAARTQADQARIEEFAVRLSVTVAERLTRAVIDESGHDVAALVRDVLLETDGDDDRSIEIRLNPDDHARVLAAVAAKDFGSTIDFRSDSGLSAGDVVAAWGETEYHARMIERLEQVRAALIEESRHVD